MEVFVTMDTNTAARWYRRYADPSTRTSIAIVKSEVRGHTPPVRPDQAADIWHTFLEQYDGDVEAALGALVALVHDHGWLE